MVQRAATPRHACTALARAINAGDLDAAVACFTPDACLVSPDATAMHGEAAIRALLGQMIASRVEVSIELAGVLVAGESALAHECWRIGPGGSSSFAQVSHPTLVLRRLGGEWKLAIAAPWGWGAAPPLEAVR